MLALIERKLVRLTLPFTPVERFQIGWVPLFLISLKAGGTGLTLTAVDTVTHYDPWWNPAIVDQAANRAYRIGQDKPVFVYRLVAAGTVEERMIALQKRKRLLAAGVCEGGGGTDLTAEDLDVLFAPAEDVSGKAGGGGRPDQHRFGAMGCLRA
ncbi:MAG: helicase/SNF2 domain-containing protein [Rhodospirillaceae bacterium]|nr:MAG: helicase/SNF2 domain-containing protein [Rhodospirillaceae bacterium]